MTDPHAKRRVLTAAVALTALAALINTSASASESALAPCEWISQEPPDPSQPPPPPPEIKPTTANTIGQAYFCIFENYFNGPILDTRSLLVPAFVGLTQELQRRGLDQSKATLPALTGRKSSDWAAFSKVYQQINADLPQDPTVRQAVAEATMRAMVDALQDNHAHWDSGRRPSQRPASLGLSLSGYLGPAQQLLDPTAVGPFFVTSVDPGSAAQSAGVRAGDEIVAINEVAPYVNGVLNQGVLSWIRSPAAGTPVTLTLRRPATNAMFTVAAMPGNQGPPVISPPGARLVDGNVGYAKMDGFAVDLTQKLLDDLRALNNTTHLRGVILDLRGNGGGNAEAVALLAGAFVHNAITGYWCSVKPHKDTCIAHRSDASQPLLNLPLVVLVDRICASACDAFSSAVKDLRFGTLVGTRTAGLVSGPSDAYRLEDGSAIWLPVYYSLGAKKQVINSIGVAPDYYLPLTAADLSAGRDPGLAKALQLLR